MHKVPRVSGMFQWGSASPARLKTSHLTLRTFRLCRASGRGAANIILWFWFLTQSNPRKWCHEQTLIEEIILSLGGNIGSKLDCRGELVGPVGRALCETNYSKIKIKLAGISKFILLQRIKNSQKKKMTLQMNHIDTAAGSCEGTSWF